MRMLACPCAYAVCGRQRACARLLGACGISGQALGRAGLDYPTGGPFAAGARLVQKDRVIYTSVSTGAGTRVCVCVCGFCVCM